MRSVFSSLPPSPALVQFIEPTITVWPSTATDFMCILPPQCSIFTGMPAMRSNSCLAYSFLAAVASMITRTCTPRCLAATRSAATPLCVRKKIATSMRFVADCSSGRTTEVIGLSCGEKWTLTRVPSASVVAIVPWRFLSSW